jgi:CMP-2-keto-3-deoxyoctulosonic acid synthetase
MGTTSGNKTLVDVASQSLTAIKVSKDTAANATGNRIFVASNLDQLGGTAVDVNDGDATAGTIRVVHAHDKTVLVSKDVNVNATGNRIFVASDMDLLAGHAVDHNSGASGDGTLRVVHATDKTVLVSKDTSVNATGNRIFITSNLDQINGTAVDQNSGNKTNGSQRIVIATDDVNISAIAAAVGTEGSAAPTKNLQAGVDDGTTSRNMKGGADGAAYVNQNALLPGEDAVADERGVKIKTLGTNTGSTLAAAINTVGGGTIGDPILTSTEVYGYSRVCIEFKNAAGGSGNDIDRLILFGSVSGSNWDPVYDSGAGLAWSAADGGLTVLIESNCYRYIKTEGLTAAGDTTVNCYWCGNKG